MEVKTPHELATCHAQALHRKRWSGLPAINLPNEISNSTWKLFSEVWLKKHGSKLRRLQSISAAFDHLQRRGVEQHPFTPLHHLHHVNVKFLEINSAQVSPTKPNQSDRSMISASDRKTKRWTKNHAGVRKTHVNHRFAVSSQQAATRRNGDK